MRNGRLKLKTMCIRDFVRNEIAFLKRIMPPPTTILKVTKIRYAINVAAVELG